MSRGIALAAAAAAALIAPAASACPVCAQRQDGALGTVALGLFIVTPWIVALSVGLYIRKTARDEAPPVSSEE